MTHPLVFREPAPLAVRCPLAVAWRRENPLPSPQGHIYHDCIEQSLRPQVATQPEGAPVEVLWKECAHGGILPLGSHVWTELAQGAPDQERQGCYTSQGQLVPRPCVHQA